MVVTETVNRKTITIPRTKLMKISAHVFRAAARVRLRWLGAGLGGRVVGSPPPAFPSLLVG